MQSQHNKKLLSCLLISLLGMVSVTAVAQPSASQPIVNDSAIASTNLNGKPFTDFNLPQQRSYDLLMRHFTQCYQYSIEHYDNDILNSNVEVTIYEKHNSQCGGDPHTFPRFASYAIDKYGRIFEYRTYDDTYNLQYKFIEKPVWVNDVTDFRHPTRTVLDKYGITLERLEKRADNTFVIRTYAKNPETCIKPRSYSTIKT